MGGARGSDLGAGFPLSQAIAVLDEEIDEGGWETSLHHKGSAAFGRLVEVGNQPRETRYFGFLPGKRHDGKPRKKQTVFLFSFLCWLFAGREREIKLVGKLGE